MPRKAASAPLRPEQADWYLPEWMATLKVSQAQLAKALDWTPSTMHGVFHGRTSYYREIVNQIARELHIEPFELLIPPDKAMALRRMRDSALSIAAGEAPEPTPSERTARARQ